MHFKVIGFLGTALCVALFVKLKGDSEYKIELTQISAPSQILKNYNLEISLESAIPAHSILDKVVF